ncbi:hypothetical protein [Phenylobacterium sp.]|uniref:hypothetical protein n=1 Tax=Phenylobacterium sp. TaxID=1871053 RepID=UPI002811DEB7|nr:hypothetical protein [Phenylobacterium sp.]
MAKAACRARLQSHARHLRAFAKVTTAGHPAVDATVCEVLREFINLEPEDLTTIYRKLYHKLTLLPPAPGADMFPGDTCNRAEWAQFLSLQAAQRGALFLVLCLELSLQEAAMILGESEQLLSSTVVSALLNLQSPEHFTCLSPDEATYYSAYAPRRWPASSQAAPMLTPAA